MTGARAAGDRVQPSLEAFPRSAGDDPADKCVSFREHMHAAGIPAPGRPETAPWLTDGRDGFLGPGAAPGPRGTARDPRRSRGVVDRGARAAGARRGRRDAGRRTCGVCGARAVPPRRCDGARRHPPCVSPHGPLGPCARRVPRDLVGRVPARPELHDRRERALHAGGRPDDGRAARLGASLRTRRRQDLGRTRPRGCRRGADGRRLVRRRTRPPSCCRSS